MCALRVFYLVKNPLACLAYAKDLAQGASKAFVVLPKHIDPSKFEKLLLEDQEYFSGINIQGISSFPQNALRASGRFGFPPKVDQIKLSEHFHNRLPRSLSRPLLNTVLELKNADFERDYLEELLNRRKDKEGEVLLEVFKEYQDFLKQENVCDSADIKNYFVDEALNPGSKIIDEDATYIFAGFSEFTSFDMDVIKTVSKKAANTFIASPDILNTELEYSKLLKESFTSLDFKFVEVEDKRTTPAVVREYTNINDEAYYSAVSLGAEGGTIYAVSEAETYYALMRYHFGHESTAISTAMRLDRTTLLNALTTLLTLNVNDWTYKDVNKVLNFMPFWKDHEAVLKFVGIANEQLTLPRGYKAWVNLAKEKDAKEVLSLFDTIVQKVPTKAPPSELQKALELFIGDEKSSLELSSVKNLIARVTECLENKTIGAEGFARKLYNHAEENYVEKGPISFKPLNVSLANICAGNTSKKVRFVGLNQEAFMDMAKEDVVMNDNFILAFRSEGFLYPSSKETALLSTKIIADAVIRETSSFISSIGPVVDILKDVPITKNLHPAPKILESAVTDMNTTELKLDHKYKALSVSLIENYMKCPYICLAENVLKTQKKQAMEFQLNPMDAGRLLHTALEILLPKKLQNPELNVEQELEEVLRSKDLKGINQHPLKRVFLKYYGTVIKKILDSEYAYMKENGLEIFQTPELKFEVKLELGENITLNGKIDRIDLDKANNKLYIADYKTSSIPSNAEIESGEDIQLAVYIMAIAAQYPGYDGYNAYYISIKEHNRTKLELSSVEKAKELFLKYGAKAVEGLKKGDYTPAPMEIETCEKCNYRRCCGAV